MFSPVSRKTLPDEPEDIEINISDACAAQCPGDQAPDVVGHTNLKVLDQPVQPHNPYARCDRNQREPDTRDDQDDRGEFSDEYTCASGAERKLVPME